LSCLLRDILFLQMIPSVLFFTFAKKEPTGPSPEPAGSKVQQSEYIVVFINSLPFLLDHS